MVHGEPRTPFKHGAQRIVKAIRMVVLFKTIRVFSWAHALISSMMSIKIIFIFFKLNSYRLICKMASEHYCWYSANLIEDSIQRF